MRLCSNKLIAVIFTCWFFHANADVLNSGEDTSLSFKGGTFTQIESAFSPAAGAEQLVLKVINNAESSLRLAAYSFTSANIVRALIKAKRRGVDVKVLVDERGNRGKANHAVLNLLVNADIPTRTVSNFAIHHDKYIISDERNLQTGSFNYSAAAAKSNSENVIVVWNQSELASAYQRHWNSRWIKATDYSSQY